MKHLFFQKFASASKPFFCLIFFLYYLGVSAQINPPAIQWERSFGRDNSIGLNATDWILYTVKTTEGGYINCGFSSFDPSTAPPTDPSAVPAIPALVKLNANGETLWEKVYAFGNNNAYGYFANVIEVSDGYVACGRKFDPVSGADKICILKTDRNGNILYQNLLSATGAITCLGAGIKQIPGGGYMVCGLADNNGDPLLPVDAIMIRLDNGFNPVWQTRVSASAGSQPVARALGFTLTYSGGTNPDGTGIGTIDGAVMTGYESPDQTNIPDDILIAKINMSGGIVWHTVIDSNNPIYGPFFYNYNETTDCTPATKNNNDVGKDVVQALNGDIVVSGQFNTYYAPGACITGTETYTAYIDCDAVLFKLENSDGTLLLAKNISHFSGPDFSANVIQTIDNGFAVIGTTADVGVISGTKDDMLLVKTDQNCNVQWRRALSGRAPGYCGCGFGITQSLDGGYVLAGNNENNNDDYEFIKLFSECLKNYPYDKVLENTFPGVIIQGFHPLNGTSWNNETASIVGELIIDPGVTFTISNSTLSFADYRQINDFQYFADGVFDVSELPPTKIVVMPGGKLIIYNSTLQGINACGQEHMWQGIEVMGSPNLNQSAANQGILELRSNVGGVNKVTIKNAITAVLLNEGTYNVNGNPDYDSRAGGGGIIRATKADFINCRFSVRFTSYPYSMTAATTLYNSSFIKDCKFENNAPMVDPNYVTNDGIRLGNNTFVSIWNKRGLSLNGNSFRSTGAMLTQTPVDYRGYGIVTFDAKFVVDRNCTSISTTTGDCAGQRSIFENLKGGIDVNTITGIGAVTIKGAQFINNRIGIVLNGTGAVSVIKNIFDIPKDNVLDVNDGGGYFGVYTTAATNFNIEENTFTSNNSAGLAGDNIAIANFNAGTIGGNVYRNTFNQIKYADMMGQDNSSLLVDCNTYNAPTPFPASATPYQWALTSGNIGTQGICVGTDPTNPQANIYNSGCTGLSKQLYFDGDYAAPFTYNSYDAIRPTCFTSGINVPLSCRPGSAPVTACPSTLSGGGGSSGLLSKIVQYGIDITDLKNKVDGGNTQTLLNSIAAQSPGQIKNDLLAQSPYLSDIVLLAAITKADPLPPGILKDILIPNSPVTAPVKTALDALVLPNGIRDQINNSQTGISVRQTLEEQISFYKSSSQSVTNQLVRYYLDSSLVDSAIIVLKAANNVDALCALIPIDIKKRDFTEAATKLTELSAIADDIEAISPFEAVIPKIRTFCQFHHAVASIESRPGSYFSITETEKQTLNVLAQSNMPIAINVQSILKLVNGEEFARLPEPIRANSNHSMLVIEEEAIEAESISKLYPNPNNGNMQFDYTLEEGDEGLLIIYNTVGQLINKYQLATGSNSLKVSEAALENGIYFYQQTVNGKIVVSDKLVIIK